MKKNLFRLTAPPIVIVMLTLYCLLPNFSQAQFIWQYDFAGPTTEGSNPNGDLISDGTFLYGMTSSGGTSTICLGGCGTIFKIKPDGTSFSNILNFNNTNGSAPSGSLIYDGTFLYGMTGSGGSSTICSGGCGTVFKIKPDGTSFTNLLNFSSTNGSAPYGSLISDGTFLYGMTSSGGSSTVCSGGCGTIFKIKPDGTSFTNLLNFNSTNGSAPFGSLISDGTFLYGMTSNGGSSTICSGGCGTIFKIKPDGTGYVDLLDFNSTDGLDGQHPYGSLILVGGTLYGMTKFGGTWAGGCSNGCGTIFKINPDGTGFTRFVTLFYNMGGHPNGSLIFDGTYFYGTTSEYEEGYGNVFRMNLNGLGFTPFLRFQGTDGAFPKGSLIIVDNNLYGMTNGGSYSNGTVFGYHDCILPLTIANSTTYNGTDWSPIVSTTVTIGTGTSITATSDQIFKFSNTTTIVGPFSSGTTSNTLGIVPTPCNQ